MKPDPSGRRSLAQSTMRSRHSHIAVRDTSDEDKAGGRTVSEIGDRCSQQRAPTTGWPPWRSNWLGHRHLRPRVGPDGDRTGNAGSGRRVRGRTLRSAWPVSRRRSGREIDDEAKESSRSPPRGPRTVSFASVTWRRCPGRTARSSAVTGFSVFQFAADKTPAFAEARRTHAVPSPSSSRARVSESGIAAVFKAMFALFSPEALERRSNAACTPFRSRVCSRRQSLRRISPSVMTTKVDTIMVFSATPRIQCGTGVPCSRSHGLRRSTSWRGRRTRKLDAGARALHG